MSKPCKWVEGWVCLFGEDKIYVEDCTVCVTARTAVLQIDHNNLENEKLRLENEHQRLMNERDGMVNEGNRLLLERRKDERAVGLARRP